MAHSLIWEELDKHVPEDFKEQVRNFLEDADAKIIAFMAESDEIVIPEKTLKMGRRRMARGSNLVDKRKLNDRRRISAARQYIILTMLSYGMEHEAIAEQMNITRQTVYNAIGGMKRTYGARTNIALVAKALRSGFIE